jgi:hypothetical protein
MAVRVQYSASLTFGCRESGSDAEDSRQFPVRFHWSLLKGDVHVWVSEPVTCLRYQKDSPWFQRLCLKCGIRAEQTRVVQAEKNSVAWK